MSDDINEADDDGRHPFRFLIKLGMLVGLTYAAGRFIIQKKNEFAGLTEAEAREKLVEKMRPKVGDDTAVDIADQVVPKLKERGLLKPDLAEVADEVEAKADEALDAAAEGVEESADRVAEAVDSLVNERDED